MAAEKKVYPAGTVLFNDGDASRSLFIIQKGSLSIRKKKGVVWIEVGTIQQGEVVGELSFFDRLPRSATAVANQDVEALEVTFESLEKIYSTIPDTLKTVLAGMAERLRATNETIRKLQNAQD
jgi:CRP/FNR family cyclic AMP-dependent transcriptional regulator